MASKQKAEPKRSKQAAPHSVRCSDETWNRAKAQAEIDGVALNYVMRELLEGYGRGMIALPRTEVTKTYEPTIVDGKPLIPVA